MLPEWERLRAMADDEVRRTLKALPPTLREAARALPVTYEPAPDEDLAAEGIEPDTLGLFVGGDHDTEAHEPIPPQIILFLENIWLMIEDAEGDERDFRFEVRTTLLHELGHYLGLGEDDLIERGLE
jgi:predicted Zn-dependent protease with MMP-like domain